MYNKYVFITNILLLRKEHNLTQYQLADIIGCERSTLASWEAGRTNPNAKHLPAIARHFGISLD